MMIKNFMLLYALEIQEKNSATSRRPTAWDIRNLCVPFFASFCLLRFDIGKEAIWEGKKMKENKCVWIYHFAFDFTTEMCFIYHSPFAIAISWWTTLLLSMSHSLLSPVLVCHECWRRYSKWGESMESHKATGYKDQNWNNSQPEHFGREAGTPKPKPEGPR